MSQNWCDVIIVGAGPSGLSTALHLLRVDAGWAERLLVLDKAIHPRDKLCGGGITRPGIAVLNSLGLSLEPRHVTISEIRFRYGARTYRIQETPLFHVVRRAEFDHWLLEQAERQGARVRQGEAVVDVCIQDGYVTVSTEQSRYRARAVVAADGSNSTVKRLLGWGDRGRKARLLEVLTPEDPRQRFEYRQGVALFDFSLMRADVQGYYWDFPSYVDGRAFMNRGVYDSRVRPELARARLRAVFEKALAQRQRHLADVHLQGHPIHWFDASAPLAQPHVLLVGDAAGVDPLFGEGISFALAYGEAAAAALLAAFARNDFSFADYQHRVLRHPHLRQLVARTRGARLLYRLTRYPRLSKLLWRLVPFAFRILVGIRPGYVPVEEPRLRRLD